MNREIKFRGKRLDSGEWTYGYLVFSEDYIFDYSERIDITYIIPINNFNLKDYREYRVDETTIGQYTDLKDKNGKDIYEGDIVSYIFGKPNGDSVEVYSETVEFNYGQLLHLTYADYVEVIGNIYESEVNDEKIRLYTGSLDY